MNECKHVSCLQILFCAAWFDLFSFFHSTGCCCRLLCCCGAASAWVIAPVSNSFAHYLFAFPSTRSCYFSLGLVRWFPCNIMYDAVLKCWFVFQPEQELEEGVGGWNVCCWRLKQSLHDLFWVCDAFYQFIHSLKEAPVPHERYE